MGSEIVVKDVTSYLNEIFGLSKEGLEVRCYRGQSCREWKLEPSVMRNLKPEAESQMFSELTLETPGEFGSDKTMFEKLVRAQHYSLPTRILDVSLNPLVGLYFACNEGDHYHKDGVVNVFDFQRQRVKFADSDVVSLICNLVRLSDNEREELVKGFRKDGDWNGGSRKEYFRSLPAMKRLSQFVRVEKPYFLDAIDPVDLFRYFFVYPAKNNKRVIAQSGAFIAAGLLKFNSPKKSPGFDTREIIIPGASKAHIIDQLDVLNINSRTMFPEIEFVSKYIKNKWTK